MLLKDIETIALIQEIEVRMHNRYRVQKQCVKCKAWKAHAEFATDNTKEDRKHSYCAECAREAYHERKAREDAERQEAERLAQERAQAERLEALKAELLNLPAHLRADIIKGVSATQNDDWTIFIYSDDITEIPKKHKFCGSLDDAKKTAQALANVKQALYLQWDEETRLGVPRWVFSGFENQVYASILKGYVAWTN